MKKILIGLLLVVTGIGCVGYVFQESLVKQMMAMRFRPALDISQYPLPPAPDYRANDAWASLPDGRRASDLLSIELNLRTSQQRAPVFFVHPTTYLEADAWNAAFDNPVANQMVDELVLRGQASTFRQCCDLYAPRYRQANFWSFMDETESGTTARSNAYRDIEASFDEFIRRSEGLPFILAGHSQGSEHVIRLLINRIAGTQLQQRLIATYAVGIPIDPADFSSAAPQIPVCEEPDQLGCYVSWNSMSEAASPWKDQKGAVCVNPISWRADGKTISADHNPGSLSIVGEPTFRRAETGAQCLYDRLQITEFQSDLFSDQPMNLGPGNYHLLDYALFYASVSDNAVLRTDRWFERFASEKEH